MVPSDAPQVEALEEFDLISLHNLLTEAEKIKAQARYFNDSQSHQAAYDTALVAGQELLNQSQASQAEVNQLVEQINQAFANLTASKTALNGIPKVKPTVSILSLTENPEDKSVTVQYSLEDKTKSLRSATAELYKGTSLFVRFRLTMWQEV